jgi:hypothetical protein
VIGTLPLVLRHNSNCGSSIDRSNHIDKAGLDDENFTKDDLRSEAQASSTLSTKLESDFQPSGSSILSLAIIFSTFLTFAFAVSEDDCIIPGDSDILGQGVRLGMYFQLSSNLLLYAVRPSEAIGSIDVSNMLLTGFFISIVYSLSNGSFLPSSVVNVQYILSLDVFVLFPVIVGKIGVSVWSYVLCILRCDAIIALYIWFWYHGLSISHEAQCMEPRVFFFHSFGAYGNIRTFFKVGTIAGALVLVVVTIQSVHLLYTCIRRKTGDYEKHWTITVKPLQVNLGFSRASIANETIERSMPIHIIIYYTVLTLAISITAMELMIKWNKFEGVGGISSSGQIIPLVVGSLSLVRSIWLVIMGGSEKPKSIVTQTELKIDASANV